MKSSRFSPGLAARLLLAALFILPLLAGFATPAAAAGRARGAVFTLSNAADGNAVLVYARAANGSLSHVDSVPTGGLGSGAGLGSQSALVLSRNSRWLYAVNAGSNEISVFAVRPSGLDLVDKVASGGEMPISLDLHGRLLYVLNAGGAGNITGFLIGADGRLTALPGSTQPLSNGGEGAAPGPAQVAFSPNGKTLVVTEKATNLILVYPVMGRLAQAPVVHPSAGQTPFGFEFSRRGFLIVSEAFGGAPNISAVSSYTTHGADITVVSPSVSAGQTAACWIAISKNDRYAYAANTGTASITSYRSGKDGALTLLEPVAGFVGEGGAAIDLAFSVDGRYLYSLAGGVNTITTFALRPDGSLANLGNVNVPAGAVGLAAH